MTNNEDYQKTFPNEFNHNIYPKNVIEFDITQASRGFEIKNPYESIYELITSEREIFCDETFFFSGVEYNFVKLIKDSKYAQQHVDKVATTYDHFKVKTSKFLRSFKEITQDG